MKRCLNCMEEYEDSRSICPQCRYGEGEMSGKPFVLKAGSILQGRYIVGTCRGIRDCDITYIGWDALFERKVLIQEFFPSRCAARDGGENLSVRNGMEELYSEGLSRYIHYHRNLIRLYKEEDIISVFSCFKANQTVYATMQYSEAMTLGQWIAQDGKPDEREAVAFLYQAVQAVKKVHALGLVHGDIRMENFWMTGTGGLVLKGFAEPCHYCGDPEQKDYGEIGSWIDVYGLSRLFGEMLLGEEDVSREDILDILNRDSIKLPVRTVMAVKGGLDTIKNRRICSLEEFGDRIFGDSATMRLVNRADRSRRKGNHGNSRKKGFGSQDLLVCGAAGAVILVAAVFFIMGRFTGRLFADKDSNRETILSGAVQDTATPGTAMPGAVTPGAAESGTGTPGMATPGTAASGMATPGTAESGTGKPENNPSGETKDGTKKLTDKTGTGGKTSSGTTDQGGPSAGQGGTSSGQGGTTSGQGGTSSGQRGTPTGQGVPSAGREGTSSGQGGTSAGREGTSSGQSGTSAGQGGTSSGQSGISTGQEGTSSGQSGASTDQRGTSTGQEATSTSQGDTPSGQDGAPSSQKGPGADSGAGSDNVETGQAPGNNSASGGPGGTG